MKKNGIFISVVLFVSLFPGLISAGSFVWNLDINTMDFPESLLREVLRPVQRYDFVSRIDGKRLLIETESICVGGLVDFICRGVFDSSEFSDIEELVIVGCPRRTRGCGKIEPVFVPDFRPERIRNRFFTYAGMQRLEEGVFKGLQKVKKLTLFVDSRASIDRDILIDLPSLESVEFSIIHGCGRLECKSCNKNGPGWDNTEGLRERYISEMKSELEQDGFSLHLLSNDELKKYLGAGEDVVLNGNGIVWRPFYFVPRFMFVFDEPCY